MDETNYIFQVGWDKNGDADFAINGVFTSMSLEEMQKFRSMIVVAIGTMEDMFRRAQERKNFPSKQFHQ